jgi:electron transfer flavoprotein alpha subunit
MPGVAVLVEHRGGAVRDVTLEMLAAARKLAAETGGGVEAILLSGACGTLAGALMGQCDRLFCAESPGFAEFNYEPYSLALKKYLTERKPAALLIAHSAFGVDLGPSLAVATDLPLVSDATALGKGDGGLLITRGMYSGKLSAEWLATGETALVMVRQSNFKAEAASLATESVKWDPGAFESGQTKFIALEEVPTIGVDITKANVIIAVGRGVKEEKNIAPIKELADAMGAVLAASRPVVDAGWLPKEVQVGSSGKTVKPKVYLALGVSGAFQHVAGMKGADTIIAVNKDPKAPIFAVAHYGIVDDLQKVVPVLRERVKELK